MPTLSVWQGNHSHHDSSSPAAHHASQRPIGPQNHRQPQTLYPVAVAGVALGRHAQCPAPVSAIIWPGAMQAKKRRSQPTHTSFAHINTPTWPPSPNVVVSSPQSPDATRKITHYSEICQGLEIARRRNSLLEDFRVGRSAFHAFQTLGDDPAEPGKSIRGGS